MSEQIRSFEDLKVYQKLCELHLEICKDSLIFPKFETYELGSQIRRSSNSAPANLAEGSNNKHTNIYLEGINRALGELRETRHHLTMAHKKNYLTVERYQFFINGYIECEKMLHGLETSLSKWQNSRRNPIT